MHFTVMVIGDNPEKQLAPFQENNMGDCPKEYLSFREDEDADLDKETGKKGWWENPNAQWDWYTLGGRWSGSIELNEGATGKQGKGSLVARNDAGIDQAKKKDIKNPDSLVTFAFLMDGKWVDRDNQDKWEDSLKNLIANVPDDALISIFDCHI